MGLLEEIQDGAIDSSSDLTTVLRKCLRLAYKLANDPFLDNGHRPAATIIGDGEVIGVVRGVVLNNMKAAVLPPSGTVIVEPPLVFT